jgi:hypothetical protein
LLLFHYVDNLVGDAEVFDLWEWMSVGDRTTCIYAVVYDDDDVSIGESQVWTIGTYVVSAHVALRQPEEFVAVGACLHDFFEGEVHVCVALDQVAVEGFAVLELDEHGVALGGCEEAEGELRGFVRRLEVLRWGGMDHTMIEFAVGGSNGLVLCYATIRRMLLH